MVHVRTFTTLKNKSDTNIDTTIDARNKKLETRLKKEIAKCSKQDARLRKEDSLRNRVSCI
jgi:hypothetical protein